MAKKVRFPLVMAEDKQARDLTELREYFSLPEVLGYVANGKLVTWLNDRYENDLAEGISALDSTDPDFEKKVCEVLGVEYQGGGVTLEDAQARNEKLAKLKEFTDDKTILDAVDSVAFEQDDIYDLLDEDCKTIYLCGNRFTVPLGKEGITYVGVNKPTVVIASKEVVDFEGKKIVFQGLKFDIRYRKLLETVTLKKVTQVEVDYESSTMEDFQIKDGVLEKYLGNDLKVVIPNCVEEIGDSSFSEKDLEHLIVPSSVVRLGNFAFSGCQSLKYISLPSGIGEIGSYAFNNCYELTDIDIPTSLSRINMGTFNSCRSLSAVKIPDSVQHIEKSAFSCASLTSISIPSSVKKIESGAFSYCEKLNKVEIYWLNTIIDIEDEVFLGCSALEEIILPQTLKIISDSMFSDCSSLKEIYIPSSIKSIESGAFRGCDSLKTIILGNKNCRIHEYAFKASDIKGFFKKSTTVNPEIRYIED